MCLSSHVILLGKEGKKEEGKDMWSTDEGGVMIKEHEKLLCNNESYVIT